MKASKDILSEVHSIMKSRWEVTDGRVVPDSDKLTLGNKAIKFLGTVLYADMEDSTKLVNEHKDWFAADMYKSYLHAACNVIRNNEGTITAFDGDRVMAVFVGEQQSTNAAMTALQVNYILTEVNKLIKTTYTNTSFQLRHKIGIDHSELFAAKTGVRNSNDLVWVGRAANYAAKLSALPDDANGTFITDTVYARLMDKVKIGGSPSRDMWTKRIWAMTGTPIYFSSWTWSF